MIRILLLFATIVLVIKINCGTPLDDYVNAPDPSFTWKLIQTYPFPTYTVYILNMTSQKWLDGIILATKTVFQCFVFSFILNPINLVALYDYHRA